MRNHTRLTSILALTILGLVFCSLCFAAEKEMEKDFVPGEDSGFYYTIKKGDTLWDLSQKFYQSNWDWPGLWEMNDEIKNPHWIYPGKRIRIFLKEKLALKPRVVPIQKVEKKVVPVKIETSFSFSEMDNLGFIRKTAQASLGSVIKEEEGNIMMSADDIIYIKPSGKGTLIPGKIYHVFTAEPLNEDIHGGTFTGIKHLIKAKLKILEHKVGYVTGVITHAYKPVGKGDLVMEYYKREPVLTVEESPYPIDARIVCSENFELMINDYRIAFIDAGSDTVKPGQIYTVLRENITKDFTGKKPKDTTLKLENLKSGKLIVLHTEDISSTVMILSSKYAIHPDDIVN